MHDLDSCSRSPGLFYEEALDGVMNESSMMCESVNCEGGL